MPNSVFGLGNGLSSVEAWFSTALDIVEVLSGTGVLTLLTGPSWIALLVAWVCLARFARFTFLFMVRFGSGSNSLLVLENHGVGMVVFPKVAL